MKKVLLATKNKGKIREFNAALEKVGMMGVPVSDVKDLPEPEETGTTFMENALLKARYYMEQTGLPAMADDSGLAVDCLDGAPGIYSARYAGHHGDDEANNKKLVSEVSQVSFEHRKGQYVCALALVFPDGREVEAEGICEGYIQLEPAGDGGFGYDPYFYLPAYGRTMAEISLDEKNKISHRGKALMALLEQLDHE